MEMKMGKSLNRHVVTTEIYSIVKNKIISQILNPGDKINIDQLAREYEVSNIPIREALSRLSAEGLVHMIPFKGVFVREISLVEFDEMFEIRIQLESLAVKKATPLIPETELNHLNHKLLELSAHPSTSRQERLELIAQMNEDLHGMILRYCGNKNLEGLVNLYIERIQRYLINVQKDFDQNHFELDWKEHIEVLRNMLLRNIEGAAEAMRNHLMSSHQRTREFFL
jgi:DNA-binding GntR family transcriptional regulator